MVDAPVLALAVVKRTTVPWVNAAVAGGGTTCGGTGACFSNFVTYELPHISGIGVSIPWVAVDNCSGTAPCSTASESAFNWAYVDTILSSYISIVPNWGTTACAGKPCKIALIIHAESDSNPNTETPPYVFTTTYANTLTAPGGGHPDPQDVIVCPGWQGGAGSPVTLVGSHSWQSGDYGIWSSKGINNGTCAVFSSGGDLSCAAPPFSDFSGYPIVYEQPIMTAYQNFLTMLAAHYSSTGTGHAIGAYIAYVRVGMASGGENVPNCTTYGGINVPDWPASSSNQLPGGYVIQPSSGNASHYMFVADSAGATGSAAPTWCQVAGCYTGQDGTITRWHNVGRRPPQSSTTANKSWPGPTGQASAPLGYSDNGYLTTWNSKNDNSGYVAAMMQFLSGLSAPFPWGVTSHYGPLASSAVPQNAYAYADAEALLAAQSGIGFGMEAANIYDPVTYALGAYPTSLQDWAANFQKYPNAPMHYLQAYEPGQMYRWAGYPIGTASGPAGASGIVVSSGTATVYCVNGTTPVDCSPYSGEYVYVSGNADPNLNGVWPVSCYPCSANQVQFLTSEPAGTYFGGNLWSPNYWPITMPFVVQRGATSLEVYECDLDYAFGVQTTKWVADELHGGGCASWGLAGGDSSYQNQIGSTLAGQPAFTSLHLESFTHAWLY